jgi:hypothetical protein
MSASGSGERRADHRLRRDALMYRYDEFDERLVRERAAQFRGQVSRRIDGSLTEDEFKPLRLMNGLYLQLHAYMLRVAIPYGTLNRRQLRQLARSPTIRPRLRPFHHPPEHPVQLAALRDVPDILEDLADVEMHCIQTSGELHPATSPPTISPASPPTRFEDPRPTAELIRQWSTFLPKSPSLPRKFKSRGDRRRTRPGPRSRSTTSACRIVPQRGGRDRPTGSWSAAASAGRPMIAKWCANSCRAKACSPISRRSCASTIWKDGATTSSRPGSRSWSTRSAPRPSSTGSRPNFAKRGTPSVLADPQELAAIAPISRRRL